MQSLSTSDRALGDVLVDRQVLTLAQLDEATDLAERWHVHLGDAILSRNWVEPAAYYRAMAQHYSLPFVDLMDEVPNLGLLSAADADGFAVVQDALKAALMDRANRGARQVEEHYLRESSAPRANNVRGRLHDGISCLDLEAIAARVLSVNPKRPPDAPLKQKGIDDGVRLP